MAARVLQYKMWRSYKALRLNMAEQFLQHNGVGCAVGTVDGASATATASSATATATASASLGVASIEAVFISVFTGASFDTTFNLIFFFTFLLLFLLFLLLRGAGILVVSMGWVRGVLGPWK